MKTLINITKETKNFSVDIDHGDRTIAHKICFEPKEEKTFADEIVEILLKFEGIELKEVKESGISILSKQELIDFALNKGIELDGTETKKELIEKIQK